MPKLADLGLTSDAVDGVDTFDALPEQRAFTPPPAPGTYQFELPSSAKLADAFDIIAANDKRGQRINLVLDQDAALKILKSPNNERNGEPFQTRISNVERKRDKAGAVIASDMDYLLQATGYSGPRPKVNKAYGDAVIKQGGKAFEAEIEWSWNCGEHRAARFAEVDAATNQVSYVERDDPGQPDGKQHGCGARYYQKDVAKGEDGTYPLHITCSTCGADVRAFANLTRFRQIKG